MGYTVLSTSSPMKAIRLAMEYKGDIDILLTDVIMPEMNGNDLSKKIRDLQRNIKCLYISGYTADVIVHHGVLDEGINFLRKPFLMKDLGTKIRETLTKKY